MSNISTKIILTNPLFFLPPSHHQGKRRFPTPFATAGTPFLCANKGVKESPGGLRLTARRFALPRQRSSRKRPRTPRAEKSWVIGEALLKTILRESDS